MSEDRNTTLANFQAITGIEDIGICMATLEQFDWNIDEAVVAATSEGPVSPMTTSGMDFGMSTTFGPTPSFAPIMGSYSTLPSSSNNVSFNVDWRGRQHSFTLNPNDTNIGALKEMLARKTGTPKENFTLIGFPSLEVQTNMKTLTQMGIMDNTSLVMVSVDSSPAFMSRGQNSNHTVKLRVQFEGQEHDLVFPSNNYVSQVKSYMSSTYHIPVTNQRWEGWPPGTSDALELKDLVLDNPSHSLTLHRKAAILNLDTDEDDLELDDHIELDSPNETSPQRKMMTVGKTAEQNVSQFIEVFEERYGTTHPMFHFGPLKGALSAAFSCPADSKKPLIVFLHSDNAVAGHLFCSQVLCSENISQYIDTNFVIWGWDLSLRKMQQDFLNECQHIFGLEGRRQVESYVPNRLPLMIVITKVQSSPQVFSVFEGDISGDALMAQLIDAVENYSQTRNIEKAAELEQEQRNQLRHLQEQEYLDSLKRDRQKDEIKKIEEKEQLLRKETEQAKLFSLSDLVPVEPEAGTVGPIADITFKLPDGERLSRRFFTSTKLRGLMYYIGSKGFIPAEYKLVQNFPKRQFEEDEMNLSLEELGLTRREILYVEELE